MKYFLILLISFILISICFLAWSSYPWSLSQKKVKGDIVDIEPDGLVDNDEFPFVLKVQTWNLSFLFGEGSEGPGFEVKDKLFFQNKLDQLVAEVIKSSPDIVCLQEVDFSSIRSFDMNQARYLAHKASFPFVAEVVSWEANYIPFPYWPFSRHFGKMKSGGAILSKYPILSNDIHLFKKPLSHPWWYNMFYPHRYLQSAIIEFGEKKISIANVHLEAFDKNDRMEQIKILLDHIADEKVQIVAGDFNMVPTIALKKSKFLNSDDNYDNDLSFDLMAKSNLLEVVPVNIYSKEESRFFTFPSSRPDRRLDYIFYERGLKMLKAEILQSTISDHLPLKAIFQIADPKFNPYSQ